VGAHAPTILGKANDVLGLPPVVAACLFDLDGVLTDTAVVHLAAWREVFDSSLPEGQRPFSDDDYTAYVDGKRREDGITSFLASRGLPAPTSTVQEISARKNDLVLEKIRTEGVRVYEGSRRYLQACVEQGLRRAVVSSSANTEAVLQVTGLAPLIELRVDGVTARERDLKGKPAPDTFLHAAHELGLAPDRCAVFEDALAGVEAGRAGAFAWVVGVDRVRHRADLLEHGADTVVEDLGELL
jgi:beta-phosphoglucomutase family hydrolase